MGSNTERAKKALDAMKLLGFSKKQATPVLKQLLKLFNNSSEPIEDDGYRALADAILDAQDSKPTPGSQQGTQAIHEESEPHGTTRDGLHHSASASQYDMDDDDDNETPLLKRRRMCATDSRQELQPFDISSNSLEPGPRQSTVSIQGAVPASPQTTRRQTRSLTLAQQAADRGDPSAIIDALLLKDPKPEPEIDVAQGSLGDGFICRDVLAGPDSSQLNIGSSAQNTQKASFVELDVASSTMGEVKMSLKCNLDPSKFSISMEDVFKMVEEKCLHSYKMLPPDFSIGNLLNEVCQSVAQLGTMRSEVNSNGGILQKDADAPFVKPISCKTAVDGNNNVAGGSSVLESSEPCLQNSIVASCLGA